jgi:hypothetical protein
MIRLRRAGVIAALNLFVVAGLAVGATPAQAVTCDPGTPLPTNNYPGTTVLATSFEEQTIQAAGFAAPSTAGTGTAGISTTTAHSGKCAAKLHVTTAAGSLANFSAPLPAGSKDVYADGWFDVTAKGVDGNNVPYFRYFTNGTRVLDVFRSNNGIGPVWLRVASPTGTPTYTRLVPSVALGSWHHLTLHAVANGPSTTVEIWFDGKLVFSSKQVAINVDTISAVQLGAEHRRQAGDVYADDVIIKSSQGVTGQPGTFAPITPTRMLDTRGTSPVAKNSPVSFQVAGVNGIPAKVASVVFNLTVTAPQSDGYITAYASQTTTPKASNMNFLAGQTRANLVTVPVGNDGKVTLFNSSGGSSQLIADVSGYYVTGTPATPGSFRSLAPSRILDTRDGGGAPVGANQTLSLQVAGAGGVPAGAAAVVFNLTVAEARAPGYITAYSSALTTHPEASNLNFLKGQIVPNLVTVPIGPDGKVKLFNGSDGATHLVVDVAGYYLPGNPTASGAFKAVGPVRALDTRKGSAFSKDAVVAFQAAGANGVPANASAVVFNLTVTEPQAFGYLAASASAAKPGVSNLNFLQGQTVPNLVVVPVGAGGKVWLLNRSDKSSQVIADIAGYFLP